jgi:hypothetical protein
VPTALDRLASILERQFLKNAFLPVFLFFPALLAPYLIWSGNLEPRLAVWERQGLGVKLMEVAAYLATTWFLAAIVASQWRNIIRLFEGYPLARLVPLYDLGKAWHTTRRTLVECERLPGSAYYEYPKDGKVLPTRLGNRLLAAERGPLERYGSDAIFLWPRIAHVVPREVVQELDDAQATLEFLLVLTMWLMLFAVGNLAMLSYAGASAVLLALCFLGPLTVAYAVYRSALPAAMEYGEQLRTAIEMYRHDAMVRLKLGEPRDVKDERARWHSHWQYVYARMDPKQLDTVHALEYVPAATPEATIALTDTLRVVVVNESEEQDD